MNIIKTLTKKAALFVAIATMLAGGVACNEKETPIDPFLTPYRAAITSFSLNADSKAGADLDSAFFTIDLKHGVVFNADSLPVGTKIDKLVANIKYSDYISTATIKMEGGKTRTGEINYKDNPTDSIDFTGKVTLTLVSEGDDENKVSRTYLLKVNVHKENVDTILWGDKAATQLPSRLASPRTQKSVNFKDKAYSLIEENDGTFTIAISSDLYNNDWKKTQVNIPFTPDVRTLSASSEAMYILDDKGNLYYSGNGMAWTTTGERWKSILGGYTDSAIGLVENNGKVEFAQYPVKKINVTEIPSDFPVKGFSNFVTLQNKWTTSPVGFFIGGEKKDGTLSNATWAFDGINWVKLSEGGFPGLSGATIVPYFGFRFTNPSNALQAVEYPVWIVMGGSTRNSIQAQASAIDQINRTLYISYDNGVNWGPASKKLQLPTEIPAMANCDNVVMNHRRTALISDYWKKASRTRAMEIDGDKILWDCPYIYLIGGQDAEGKLNNTIWRGVLARLYFTPIF